MKQLKITSAVELDGKKKKTSKTFRNVEQKATSEKLKECADAINSIVKADEKSAYVIEITEL